MYHHLSVNPGRRRIKIRYRSKRDGSVRQLATRIPPDGANFAKHGEVDILSNNANRLSSNAGDADNSVAFRRIWLGVRQLTEMRLYVDCSLVLFGNFTTMDLSWSQFTKDTTATLGQREAGNDAHKLDGNLRKFRIGQILQNTNKLPDMCNSDLSSSEEDNRGFSRDGDETNEVRPASGENAGGEDASNKSKPNSEVNQGSENSYEFGLKPVPTSSNVLGQNDEAHTNEGGRCPECFEMLNHKLNYLINEMKDLRSRVDHYDGKIRKIQLHHRGCHAASNLIGDKSGSDRLSDRSSGKSSSSDSSNNNNNNSNISRESFIANGQTIRNETSCEECLCSDGRLYCRRTGCPQLRCRNPTLLSPDACCPVCKLQCHYMGSVYEHGDTFSPKNCTLCTCDNSDMRCRFITPSQCPSVDHCDGAKRVWPHHTETIASHLGHGNHVPHGGCCPVCKWDDFCSSNTAPRCSPHAECVNRKFGRECRCKRGYFGNGVECFDIDECALDDADWDHYRDGLLVRDGENTGGSEGGHGGQRVGHAPERCGFGARCVNTPGSYRCECMPGFIRMDDFNCLDILLMG